jgi:hypothetical protein
MRIPWREILGFLVGAALILFVAWALGLIPTYVHYCYDQQSADKECPVHNIALVAFWEIGKILNWISPAITAIATAFIGLFTWTLWQSTNKLWKSSETTAKNQLRAFVFAKGFDQGIHTVDGPNGQQRIKEFVFFSKIENVGLTPATDLRSWIKYQALPMLENKEPHFEWTETGATTPLGPHGTGQTRFCPIPIETMIEVWENRTEVYVATRIEYRDIFNPSIIHHHEQCARVELIYPPTEIRPRDHPAAAQMLVYGPQNTVA